jgi:iron complex transport system ATP-binding protein
MNAVVLEDVEVRVRGSRILGPVSLRVRDGERWALLGPNGSGKTTLLSVVGAWRQPSGGTAEVLGERVGSVDVRALRARIGHVGHTIDRSIRGNQPVRDVVLTGRSSTLEAWFQTFDPHDRAEADGRLAQVGCGALAERSLATCSQGERQRVMLARALFGRREMILFDEPAAGLDLPGRETLLTAMASVGDRDTVTTITATHHLEELPATTSHAILLRGGSPIAVGPVEETLTEAALSEMFGLPVRVGRDRAGRWSATAW